MWTTARCLRHTTGRRTSYLWHDQWTPRRGLLTLAIETSCDDSSVAILKRRDHKSGPVTAKLHFHDKVTANTEAYGGIHPVVALESHQTSLGHLVQKALAHLPTFADGDRIPASTDVLWGSDNGQLRKKPDFISVTRGPGMRPNLTVGLSVAKGLALAWNVPLVGVHHMQAHALTPRLVNALGGETSSIRPEFPFLSMLVSGGHTILVSSNGLVDHRILASTCDTAVGDYLDKVARTVVPPQSLSAPYGRALELLAFPDGEASYKYQAPVNRQQELQSHDTTWGWSLSPPLSQGKGGRSGKRMEYSFSGLLTSVQRITGSLSNIESGSATRSMENDERQMLAREAQRIAFEHLCGRIILHLKSLPPTEQGLVKNVVVSGGVAANHFLRHVFRSMLDAQGYSDIELVFPPIEFCTDNAAMIAWAGCEMYLAGYRSDLSILPIRKWSLDPDAEDGGIVGVPGTLRM